METRGRRMVGKRYHKPGTAPGTLRAPENPPTGPVRVTLIDYSAKHFEEKQVATIEECFPYRETSSVTWINVDGLHDIELIEKLGKAFGLHPLALEDVLNCGQRPKLEDYGSYHFVVMRSLYLKKQDEEEVLESEQISFFLAGNYVITLQEIPGDSFEAVRERLRHGKGLIRKSGPDYLLFFLQAKSVAVRTG